MTSTTHSHEPRLWGPEKLPRDVKKHFRVRFFDLDLKSNTFVTPVHSQLLVPKPAVLLFYIVKKKVGACKLILATTNLSFFRHGTNFLLSKRHENVFFHVTRQFFRSPQTGFVAVGGVHPVWPNALTRLIY